MKTNLQKLIEELVEQELEEVNALAAGNVVGYIGPLGMDTAPLHKAFWSGDEKKLKSGSPTLHKKKSMKDSLKENLDMFYEAKIDDLKSKFPAIADKLEHFREVPQKYIGWIAKELNSGIEHEYKIDYAVKELINTILTFDKAAVRNLIQKKDINAYRDAADLESALKNVDFDSTKNQLKKQVKQNAKLIHKDEKYTIISPESMEASCYYGYGTKWCISAKESDNYFKSYSDQGAVFYFVIDKQPTNPKYSKVALAVYPDGSKIEFYDTEDNRMEKEEFMALYPKNVLNALDPIAPGQFKTHLEIIQSLQIEKMDDKSFIKFIQTRGREAGESSQAFNPRHDDDEDKSWDFFKELIRVVPLDKLALMYYVDGFHTSPQGAGSMQDIQDRLKTSVGLNMDVLIGMMQKTFSVYRYDSEYSGYDMYSIYLDNPGFGLEEMEELGNVRITKNGQNPYSWRLKDKALDLYISSLGFPAKTTYGGRDSTDIAKAIKNYYNSVWVRNSLTHIANAQQKNDTEWENDEWENLLKSYSIPRKTWQTVVDLHKAGKLLPYNGNMEDTIMSRLKGSTPSAASLTEYINLILQAAIKK